VTESKAKPAHGILFAALLIIGIGNSMLQPLLPPLARELGLPDSSIGWIFSLSALFWVVASPLWGRRSDRVGRKPIVALGMAAYCVSMGLFALVVVIGRAGWLPAAAVFAGLMLSRAIFGAVGSATNPAAQAYIADRSEPSMLIERIAALTAAFALGAALGPALCALLAGRFGLVFPIALTSIAAGIAAWLVWRLLPEPEPPHTMERAAAPSQWRFARDPRLAPFLVFGLGLSTVAGTLQQTYTLFLMDRLGVRGADAAEQASAGFILGAFALLLTQIVLLPRLKLPARRLMSLGAALVLVGVGVQMIAFDLTWLVIASFVQGIGFGLARSGFAGGAAISVQPQEHGAAAGLVVAANGAGFILSPITGGVAYDYLHHLAPLIISVVVLAAMAAHAHFHPRFRSR
jgi:MFS family permease